MDCQFRLHFSGAGGWVRGGGRARDREMGRGEFCLNKTYIYIIVEMGVGAHTAP